MSGQPAFEVVGNTFYLRYNGVEKTYQLSPEQKISGCEYGKFSGHIVKIRPHYAGNYFFRICYKTPNIYLSEDRDGSKYIYGSHQLVTSDIEEIKTYIPGYKEYMKVFNEEKKAQKEAKEKKSQEAETKSEAERNSKLLLFR